MSRYHVSSSEGQYEKDSGEQVLANKLGIATSDEMDEAELVLLEQLYQSVFEEQFPGRTAQRSHAKKLASPLVR